MKRPKVRLTERERRFFREVGNIVLGVLIALGLGAVATEIGWRLEVANAREAHELELGRIMGGSAQRLQMRWCVERRLDQVIEIVDDAAETGRLPPVGDIQRPAFRTWDQGVWESIVSAQVAAHFGREELGARSAISSYVSWLRDLNRRELQVWTDLYSIVGPGRLITPEEIISLRRLVSEARILHRSMMLAGVRIEQHVQAFDLGYDANEMRRTIGMVKPFICQPINPTAPKHYGQAPLRYSVEVARETPVTRPEQ